MKPVHQTVMAGEVTEWLTREGTRGGLMVDATLGEGGHSEALLSRREDIQVIGMDQDPEAIQSATARLGPFGSRFKAIQSNFREMANYLKSQSAQGVVMDLGVSSRQLGSPERGFSFQKDGPLDMRMDQKRGMTAADLVNRWNEKELARIFREFGEEGQAERFAQKIGEVRKNHPIRTTGELAELAVRWLRGGRLHPATRIFQALRMAVNDESGALTEGLKAAWQGLANGGRLAVISFHSIEDRIVKQQFKEWLKNGEMSREVGPKPIKPSREEILRNPRARSAGLRRAERKGE